MSEFIPEATSEAPVAETQQSNAFAALEARLSGIETELRNACRELTATRRKLRSTWLSGIVLSVGLITIALNPASRAQVGVTLNSLNTRVTTLETKTAYMTVQAASTSGNNTGQVITRFSGCNVQIDNGNGTGNSAGGLGTTTSATGTGNLILGFDEAVNSSTPNTLTGSHNLILGSANSYSSYGGIVAGYDNSISGPFALVIGGIYNKAEGYNDVTIGGYENIANSGNTGEAVILGGGYNKAEGSADVAVGGFQNTANSSGGEAVVVGGEQNSSSGSGSTIVGGYSNTASTGDNSSIFGGAYAAISSLGQENSIFGGAYDKITGSNSTAVLIGYNGTTSAAGATSAKY